MPSRRHNARIAVLQTLFEAGFPGRQHIRSTDEILQRNIEEIGADQVDTKLATALLQGIAEHEDDLRSTIQLHAPQWPMERMDAIARALLFIGAYELLIAKDAPAAVVMNEAIDIAKEFGEQEAGKFVNGVLNAIAHSKE